MLTTSAVDIGVNIAEVLTDSNKKLSTKASTLVSQLSSVTANSCFTQEFSSKGTIKNVLVAATRGEDVDGEDVDGDEGPTQYRESEHDTIMDNYILDLSKLVNNYLSFARSVVNPKVSEFREKMEEALCSHSHKDPEEFFNVTYYKPHDIFNGQLVKDEVSSLSGKTNHYKKESLNLKTLEEVEYKELEKYFLTGHEGTDRDLLSWLGGVTDIKTYLFSNVSEFNLPLTKQLDYALVNFLFYRNLHENPEVNTGETTVVIKRKAFENKEYFGNLLASTLKSYEIQIKSGKLLSTETDTSFSYISEGPFDVVIFEENFAKVAEKGCGIETIFGYLSSVDSSTNLTVDNLVENKEAYANTWLRTRGLYLVHLNSKRIDIFKHLARTTFDDSLSEGNLTEVEVEQFGSNSAFREETLEQGHNYISSLCVEDIEDLECISLKLVAGIRFRFSNAYDILKSMDDLLKADEDLDPKEAALYSAIDVLLDFCLEQVEVVSF